MLSLLVMKPVEKAISNYYVNDAKRILHEHRSLTVIGVTGSYGKTSTKFILGRILNEKYNTLVTPENYNTPMGVVITVRNYLKPQTEIFVCEMGAKETWKVSCNRHRWKRYLLGNCNARRLGYKTRFQVAVTE